MRRPARLQDAIHRALALLAPLALLIAGCEPTSVDEPETASLHVTRPATRLRVVSLSPAATRFVLALEAGDLLVGVDRASRRIDGLGALPRVVDLEIAHSVSPELVLVPAAPGETSTSAGALEAIGAELVEFAPHDLEDVFALYRTLGARLVGRARAGSLEFRLSRPLAEIGGASFGRPRPRVLGVVSLEPLVLAGGHSFETDLIELAGGRSVTHGGEAPRRTLLPGDWERYAPDLVLVMTPEIVLPEERARLEAVLPRSAPLRFFASPPRDRWIEEMAEAARRLRALIEPISNAMQTPG